MREQLVVDSIPTGPVATWRLRVLAEVVNDSGENLNDFRKKMAEADNALPPDIQRFLRFVKSMEPTHPTGPSYVRQRWAERNVSSR